MLQFFGKEKTRKNLTMKHVNIPGKVQNQEGTEQKEFWKMHRKYREMISAGLVLTMAGAMVLQGCGQKKRQGRQR